MAAIVFAFASCAERETDPAGPNLFDRFGPFEVEDSLSASAETVDFSQGETISFNNRFNKNVPWVLTITGQTSGGKKIIENFSQDVDANNSTWNGGTTEPPLFRNEMCTVVLTVPEEPQYADTVMIEVTGTRSFDGDVACDFETLVPSGIQLGDFEFELTPESGRSNDTIAAEGEFFFRLEGLDNTTPGGPTNNFFVGLARIFPTANGDESLTYFQVPTTVPEQLYLNLFVRGRNSAFTRIVLGLIIDTNDSGSFEEGQDDVLSLEFDPLYEGWRLQSFTAADFGATQEQLSKVVGIETALISLNNLQPTPRQVVGFEMDYLTFTAVFPLQTE
jgi:hypothetical protein